MGGQPRRRGEGNGELARLVHRGPGWGRPWKTRPAGGLVARVGGGLGRRGRLEGWWPGLYVLRHGSSTGEREPREHPAPVHVVSRSPKMHPSQSVRV